MNDTIAAISTAYGRGGIAVIRISGEEAIPVADKCFAAANRKALALQEHGHCIYGAILKNGMATSVHVSCLLNTICIARSIVDASIRATNATIAWSKRKCHPVNTNRLTIKSLLCYSGTTAQEGFPCLPRTMFWKL